MSSGLLRPLAPPVPARQLSLITYGEGLKARLMKHLKEAILRGVPDGLKTRNAQWRIMDVNPG